MNTWSVQAVFELLKFLRTFASPRMYPSLYVECVITYIFAKLCLRINTYSTNITMANDIYICIVTSPIKIIG